MSFSMSKKWFVRTRTMVVACKARDYRDEAGEGRRERAVLPELPEAAEASGNKSRSEKRGGAHPTSQRLELSERKQKGSLVEAGLANKEKN